MEYKMSTDIEIDNDFDKIILNSYTECIDLLIKAFPEKTISSSDYKNGNVLITVENYPNIFLLAE